MTPVRNLNWEIVPWMRPSVKAAELDKSLCNCIYQAGLETFHLKGIFSGSWIYTMDAWIIHNRLSEPGGGILGTAYVLLIQGSAQVGSFMSEAVLQVSLSLPLSPSPLNFCPTKQERVGGEGKKKKAAEPVDSSWSQRHWSPEIIGVTIKK